MFWIIALQFFELVFVKSIEIPIQLDKKSIAEIIIKKLSHVLN